MVIGTKIRHFFLYHLYKSDISLVRTVIRAIGRQTSLAAHIFQMVYEIGRRHPCQAVKLAVEVAVVGIAQATEQRVERRIFPLHQGVGGLMETTNTQQLLGCHPHIVGKDASELPFTEAGRIGQRLHTYLSRVDHLPEHMFQWLQIGRVLCTDELL